MTHLRSILRLAALPFLLYALMIPGSGAFVINRAATNYLVLNSRNKPLSLTCSRSHLDIGFQKDQNTRRNSMSLMMAGSDDGDGKKSSNLPFFLDPGTKGGAVFLSLVLFIVPLILYNISLASGLDMIDANRIFGVGFTVVLSLAWVSTYIFRVATKDMTYAKQLKDYENAVMQKRLEELDEDEVQALMEEVDRDEF